MTLTLTDDNGRSISIDIKYCRPTSVKNLETVLITGMCLNLEHINKCKDEECIHFGNCIYKLKENNNG